MNTNGNSSPFSSYRRKCKFCKQWFTTAKIDGALCNDKCRQAYKRKLDRLTKDKEEKELLQKGISLKNISEDKAELLESLKEFERTARDLRKWYEDLLTEQRPEVVTTIHKIILMMFNNARKEIDSSEDGYLAAEIISKDFNYQMWDMLEGRTFEREDESQAWDDDDDETLA
jgi:hypothetical protein